MSVIYYIYDGDFDDDGNNDSDDNDDDNDDSDNIMCLFVVCLLVGWLIGL
jgi:hypothetical protein